MVSLLAQWLRFYYSRSFSYLLTAFLMSSSASLPTPPALFSEITVTSETARELGLTAAEYDRILETLGRTPTYTELGIFSVMWSEHCSYKNSILQLKTLPRSGGRLLVEAGEENAGLMDIGTSPDGRHWGIAFKIESHNHPSAIEPVQGAATGVGGILRDIFTMGARPIAALNSLRFGNLDESASASASSPKSAETRARTRFLVKGVVSGIAHYGNAFGVPTVGGEVYFDDCYAGNPLVNAMAVGIVEVGKTASAAADGVGNPVMILGSSTGRDGIHGASMASKEFDESPEDMRPTVQVGDPFAEKTLLEATLELIESGVIAGMQDMGAAGICCSTSEMSAKSGTGMTINLDLVPLREQGMSAYEIMLSESQERMLAVVRKGCEAEAKRICDKWDVPMVQIGEVTQEPDGEGLLRFFRNGKQVVHMPAKPLVLGGAAPVYEREWREAEYFRATQSFDASSSNPALPAIPHETAFWRLLASPTIASKRWIYEQYDSQVGASTVLRADADAAVVRLRELPGRAIAVATDCNSRYVYLNPHKGGMIAVAEAARNVACTGAVPVGITNCLNFGNPYNPEVYWQFREAVRGMGDACRALDTPVTGGNVSFHNESRSAGGGRTIFPTPTIGMLGIIDDVTRIAPSGFRADGDAVVLLGNQKTPPHLGGSEFLKTLHGLISGDAPDIDLAEEVRLQQLIVAVVRQGVVRSAHDCSEGGLAICLAEKAIKSAPALNGLGAELGAEITMPSELSAEALFGEAQSRIVVSLAEENLPALKELCALHGIEHVRLGKVVAKKFSIAGVLETSVDALRKAYEEALPRLLA
jgi:phosphoribosylformylglycinamidine synthase subunit PurL